MDIKQDHVQSSDILCEEYREKNGTATDFPPNVFFYLLISHWGKAMANYP
jgi:hypothetical protein